MKPQPIETAIQDEDIPILASGMGRVWFQCTWDPEDQCWVTFNRYVESDLRQPTRVFKPTMWMPLPPAPDTMEGDPS